MHNAYEVTEDQEVGYEAYYSLYSYIGTEGESGIQFLCYTASLSSFCDRMVSYHYDIQDRREYPHYSDIKTPDVFVSLNV